MKLVKRSLLLFFFAAFAQTLFAQATLSIQGIIQKSNGAAVDDGKYDLTFKLYTVASGGSAVHTETQNIAVAGGIYSAELGSGGTPLTAAFDQTYYLGVSVDGGAELIPRARLTSSPYALALLGTANLFPSSGAIGAGTITPTSGYQMHIRSASAAGKLLVEGSTAAQIDFKKGSVVGAVGFGTANNDFIINPGSNNTTLQHNGNTRLTVNNNGVDIPGTLSAGTLTATNFSPANMAITSKLAVGQGSVDANNTFKVTGKSLFTDIIEVNGNSSAFGGVHKGAYCDYGFCGTNSVAIGVSIRASNAIVAQGGLWSTSDFRIKKGIQTTNPATDLSLLRQLRVTKYNYIDEIGSGERQTNGFIAQEVMKTYPEAVSLSSDFVPNIYERTQAIRQQAGLLTISLEKEHELAAGDEVKIILEDDSQQMLTVESTPSSRSFVVEWSQDKPKTVFVYGKKVADFHTVDYDRIFTLNVSATQELARKVEQVPRRHGSPRPRRDAVLLR